MPVRPPPFGPTPLFAPAFRLTSPRLTSPHALAARAEEPYTRLLRAGDADEASSEWDAFCAGMRLLNAYLEENASRGGPLFLGHEPSLAEAATAPALFRMIATVRGGEGEGGVHVYGMRLNVRGWPPALWFRPRERYC